VWDGVRERLERRALAKALKGGERQTLWFFRESAFFFAWMR